MPSCSCSRTAARFLCPVAGCPDSVLNSRNQNWTTFGASKEHLNLHCCGARLGAVPPAYLRQHQYTICPECNCLIHERYNGLHSTCRPIARARADVEALRTQTLNRHQHQQAAQTTSDAPTTNALPNLNEIHQTRYLLTLRRLRPNSRC